MSWCIYNHMVGGQNLRRVNHCLKDIFRLDIPYPAIYRFKSKVHSLIQPQAKAHFDRLMAGRALYIDETEVKLRGSKGYVWVFANEDSVHYIYRESRSAAFLPEYIRDFDGVVVSDFFTGYDSLPGDQQKCLIHWIREINAELLENPFDDEFRSIVDRFAKAFRPVTETIDRFGLKKRSLRKHRDPLRTLFTDILEAKFVSDLAKKHQAKIAKYGERMLTFLDHDGVCWNNNFAENAIKPFARVRRFADGRFTPKSVAELLSLMGVIQTLERQGKDILEYLLGLAPQASTTPSSAVAVNSQGFGDRPEEKVIIKRLMSLRRKTADRDRLTYDQIATLLNSEGVPTRRGGRWWGTTVRNVIRRARRNGRASTSTTSGNR